MVWSLRQLDKFLLSSGSVQNNFGFCWWPLDSLARVAPAVRQRIPGVN